MSKLYGLLLFFIATQASELKVPSVVWFGQTVQLECNAKFGVFEIESIAWLKDDQVFFKYEPGNADAVTVTPIEGFTVEKNLSTNGERISINPVSVKASGIYTCEAKFRFNNLVKLSGSLVALSPVAS